jgi:integration host factor subunit alpha
MSLGKKDIVKNISSKAQISSKISQKLLKSFLNLVTSNSKTQSVKISNFGTFYYHRTPKRKGRNPKTKEEFVINPRFKLSLKPSPNIKKLIN